MYILVGKPYQNYFTIEMEAETISMEIRVVHRVAESLLNTCIAIKYRNNNSSILRGVQSEVI